MAGFVELTKTPVNVTQFVAHWRQFYTDDDRLYFDNINEGSDLSTDNVVALMTWKAQGRFTLAKEFGRAINPATLNGTRHKGPLDDQQLEDLFESITAKLREHGLAKTRPLIWPVFLCHLAQPQSIPIYDINAWIAWGWIADWIEPKHYKLTPSKLSTYLEFRTWFNDLVSMHSLDPRELDRALMALGRFLLSGWGIPFR